jgi:RND family efflux transporter MFP subunit
LWFRIARVLFQIALSAALLFGALWGARELLRTPPRAKRTPPPRQALPVDVVVVRPSAERVRISGFGSVVAAREIDLRVRVSGEIVEVASNLDPGGLLRAGEAVVRIDPADYETAVKEASAAVLQARSALRLERGGEAAARVEYELIGEEVPEADRDLVLRGPQVESARAALAAAQARLERARLNLDRTTVPAPFDAVVVDRTAVAGARVTDASVLARIVATDVYWVEVTLPMESLRWIRIPSAEGEEGSAVRVFHEEAWGAGVFREGRVFRLAPGIEPQGRLARLLVAVGDPLGREVPPSPDRPALVLGQHLRVEIDGPELPGVVALDRSLLRDDDRVYVLDAGDRLAIREVEVAFRERDRVLVRSGLAAGDRVVASRLSAPVEGMQLRAAGDPAGPGPRGGPGGGGKGRR